MSELESSAGTATAIELEGDRTVRDRTVDDYDRDPRTVRWGYNPGMRNIHILNRQAGLDQPLVPIGQFFAIRTFPTPKEICTVDENKPTEELVTQTAGEAELVVREVLDKVGYQSVLFGMEDRAMAKVIERILIPTLGSIREIFGEDAPIDALCQGQDELDLGVARDHCATCHLAWIVSPECKAYMELMAKDGVPVVLTKDGKAQRFALKPNPEILERTRASVQAGLETYIKYAAATWAMTVSEIESKKRDAVGVDEHMMRKDLHEFKLKDQGLGQMAAFADRLSENLGSGPRETAGSDELSPAMREFMERAEERADARERDNREFMLTLVGMVKGNPAETVKDATAAAESVAEGAKTQ